MKITIYELLGLIKDGKAPKKIKYSDRIFKFESEFNDYYDNMCSLFEDGIKVITLCFDHEVEIVEEEKEIEKIDFRTLNTQKEKNRVMKDTINQLIDEISRLKKGDNNG